MEIVVLKFVGAVVPGLFPTLTRNHAELCSSFQHEEALDECL
jgi:hypothetical protein